MSPIIIALGFGILYLIEVTFLFRMFVINERAKSMLILWLVNLPILIICCIATEWYNLFPNDHMMGGFAVNLILTLFFYTAGFFGGILQLYNLADRGFSLRILIDIMESGHKGLDLDEVMCQYSQGKGISWMYQKRLDNMQENGLISVLDNSVNNTLKGKRIAELYIKLRKIINLH